MFQWRKRTHGDFSEELQAHLELETDRLRDEGLSEKEAYDRARRNLGNLTNTEERFYESSRWIWFDQLKQDVRYSLRQLRKTPGFTTTVVLTLALGIGATTAIFTLIHAVLLKSLPVAKPDQLYGIGDTKHGTFSSGLEDEFGIFSYDLYKYFRDHTAGFESLAAFDGQVGRIGVRRSGSPQAAQAFFGQFVSGNYFTTFGITAFTGRAIGLSDDRPGAAPAAMMSYRVWQQDYALNPSVIGATFNINGSPVTIIGVTPPGFYGDTLRTNLPDFWMPLSVEPVINRARSVLNNPDLHWLFLMGRIQAGANPAAMESQMKVELRQWLTTHSAGMSAVDRARISHQTLRLSPGGAGVASLATTYASSLHLLMAVSVFVLLIVCANIANLVLVRGLERTQQTSISIALGASRSRLIRQAVTESVLLALIGGAGGLLIAFNGTQAILAMVFKGASYVPIHSDPDLSVLLFALLVSLATGLVFAIAPAWTASRTLPIDAMRGASRSTRNRESMPQRTLVVVQAALSLVLLAAAGLLTQSLRNLANQSFGFATDGRVAVRIDPRMAGYKPEQLESLYRKIKDRMLQLPGALSVSYSLYSPMSGSNWSGAMFVEGATATSRGKTSAWNRVGPDYFETVGTRVLRGRPITIEDTATSRHVAVVNQEFARQFFENQDPIGRHFGKSDAKYALDYEIVGLVEDAKYQNPQEPVFPMCFMPTMQFTPLDDQGDEVFEIRSLYINDVVIRLAARNESIGSQIRQAFAEIDPNLTVIRLQSFEDQLANNFNQQALIARLTSLFGILALILASIGLYGLTAYAVERRTSEIGIRMALGADRKAVLRLVLRGAFLLTGIGLLAGIPLTLSMGWVLGNRLYGIGASDPLVLAGAIGVLAASALMAALVPALRAAAVAPMRALRTD